MKRIPLTQGKFAIVDDSDFEWLNQWVWHAWTNGKGLWYCRRAQQEDKHKITIAMHRVILNPPKGVQVDHENGNGLDNRRGNLRECTAAQNQHNQSVIRGVSKFKGVSLKKGKWVMQISINKEQEYLGTFPTEEEAARAYDGAALEHFGEFACTNKMLGLLVGTQLDQLERSQK